jgi:ribonuclease VapC
MLVDTSVIVALAQIEDDALRLSRVLKEARHPVIGVQSVVEASCVMLGRRGDRADLEVDEILRLYRIEIVELPVEATLHARRAWARFGKGIGRPGALNFGDCLVYGHARALGVPLLATGDDFRRTDLELVPY